MWTNVIRYAEATSTNYLALDHARRGAPHGTAVVAAWQSAGRGRRGRDWQAPPGEALLVSYVLRPPAHLAHSAWPALSGGIAAAYAVRDLADVPVQLKWPNDVLVEGRKLAGVLCQTALQPDGLVLALGIGLNLNQTADSFGDELIETATSLYLRTEREFDADVALAALSVQVERLYEVLLRDGPLPLRDQWRELDTTIGRVVTIDDGEHPYRARAVEIDPQGALVVQLEDGEERRLVAADVTVHVTD